MRLCQVLLLFHEFNILNNTGGQTSDSIYDTKMILKSHFGMKTSTFCHIFAMVMDVIS